LETACFGTARSRAASTQSDSNDPSPVVRLDVTVG
jgi:hypothetical protein